jgi:hypothetical protein
MLFLTVYPKLLEPEMALTFEALSVTKTLIPLDTLSACGGNLYLTKSNLKKVFS